MTLPERQPDDGEPIDQPTKDDDIAVEAAKNASKLRQKLESQGVDHQIAGEVAANIIERIGRYDRN
jgi:hypothetical protein